MRYAAGTDVPADRSKVQIEQTLRRYGADQFVYGWESEGRAMVGFRVGGRQVRLTVAMPDHNAPEFHRTPTGRLRRAAGAAEAAYEQATRQRWRALALVIKAKLEAVESGIASFEQEFLAHLILPNGQTVGEYTIPRIIELQAGDKMPRLLPAVGNREA